MKLNDALRFATEKHRGQKRKITHEDYIFHPLEVALIVAQYTNNLDTIIAAVLHDTLEDTDTSPKEIVTHFGENVLSIILECSEKDKTLPWKQRKILMLEAYPHISEAACLIILSDKICNLKSIHYNYSDHIWDYFHAGIEDQKWIYTESLEVLKDSCSEYPELVEELTRLVDIIFSD
jgi:(p)ppGpp synthase/HD superfamily hydrolase